MCPVDDHGLEVLKKSGEQVTPGDKSNYYIKTKIINTDPIPVSASIDTTGLATDANQDTQISQITSIINDGIGIRDNVHNKPTTFSAFGSQKIVQDTTLGDYRFDLETIKEIFDIDKVSHGRYEVATGATGLILKTEAYASSSISIKSKRIHKYRSGYGLISKHSVITFDSGVSGNVRIWGLICENNLNGVFFKLNGAVLSLVIMNNGVETSILASAWDEPQTHNGFNHHYYIQMQWLGVGDIYIYKNGDLVHTYAFTNTATTFSIGTPDLRVFYSNENTTNATDVQMLLGCASVATEGGNTGLQLDQNPNLTDLAMLTKNVLAGETENAEYVNIKATTLNELLTYTRLNVDQAHAFAVQLEVLNKVLRELKLHTLLFREAFDQQDFKYNDVE